MCFIKKNIQHKPVEVASAFNKVITGGAEFSYSQDQESTISSQGSSFQKIDMISLLGQLLQTNTACLNYTFEELGNIQNELQNTGRSLQKMLDEEKIEKNKTTKILTIPPFLEYLFPKKHYTYQLKLQKTVPSLLYKERNFDIEVGLFDAQGNKVSNNNLISVYFAVCSTKKEWIHENRQGEPLIKGKNEVELFHGKGQFQKIYLRDVTKPYPGQKFNLVVYAKPSVLKMTNNSAFGNQIDSDQIMPLVIRNVTVLAKKKYNK